MAINKERLKESYMEYQLLMQQLQQLQQNTSALEKHIVDLRNLNENLASLNQSEVDTETLMPLGSGIFVKGSLRDNNKVLMNVGSNVCIEKGIDEAKETVSKQLEEVTNVIIQLQHEIQSTTTRLSQLQKELQNIREEELN